MVVAVAVLNKNKKKKKIKEPCGDKNKKKEAADASVDVMRSFLPSRRADTSLLVQPSFQGSTDDEPRRRGKLSCMLLLPWRSLHCGQYNEL